MIYNIIDRRKRPFRWREVNAIIEATAHDNAIKDSDHVPASTGDITYDELENVSLQEAIAWADSQVSAVTLYLYDKGKGFG
ncbi:hypothetical protein [Novosphingobium sp. B 225]|uniref:hypothetical protein n=1 Tax=Novosphingobium sp. B 225 TaxID=1961849 RepID=UPI000B4B565E|nr:hypothetical protein [Novosphingobium sp. B 225]